MFKIVDSCIYLPLIGVIASEYRSWLLYYGILVLNRVLDKEYFDHFVLFAEAIWLLLQSTPTLADVNKAE